MKYAAFVSVNGMSSKTASDLARLLDDPLFVVKPKDGAYGMAQERQKAFDRFCRACLDANVPLPALESELIDCHLPHYDVSEQDRTAAQVLADQIETRVQRDERREAEMCRVIAKLFLMFPDLSGGGSVNKASLVAKANRCLLKLGLEPLRPEYPALSGRYVTPPRDVKILIVDDQSDAILATAIALAGWPNVSVEWLHQQSGLGFEPTPEEKDPATAQLAQEVINRQCSIVLMDQGLRGLEGHLVVKKVKEQNSSMVFVANTSGSADKLLSVGCVGSAEKGRRMFSALDDAFGYLSD